MMANEKRYTEWLTGVKHLVYKVKKSKQTDIATMAWCGVTIARLCRYMP